MQRVRAIATVQIDGLFIRAECQRRGWNQEELSRQSGLSRPTISVAYRGGTITPRTAKLIQEAFNRVKPTLDGLIRTA